MSFKNLEEILEDADTLDELRKNPYTFSFSEAPHLTVTVAPWVPHVKVFTDDDGVISIGGPTAKTLEALAESINFTYTLVNPPDGEWGLEQKDGTWSGMVGQVYRKEADIGLGPFAMTYSRAKVIDFTVPILQDYFRILVKRGIPEPDPWGFVKPFSSYLWVGIFLSAVGLSLLLLLSNVCLSSKLNVKQYFVLWSEHFFDCVGIFASQDMIVKAPHKTVYVIIACWMIFCLVTMRSYAGSLTSQLSVRYMPAPIKNLEDLVNHPDMNVALEINTAFSDYVKNADGGLFGELSKFYSQGRMSEVISPSFPNVMKEDVGSGDFVLLIDELTILRLMSMEFSVTGSCDYYLADDRFKPWILSFIGQKNHPLVPALSARILSVVESGFYMRWIYEEMPNATSCNSRPSTVSVSEPYGLQGLWGLFSLLLGGVLMSILLFVAEVMVPNFKDLPSIVRYKISTENSRPL